MGMGLLEGTAGWAGMRWTLMMGADGGENGAGQRHEGGTPVSGEKIAALGAAAADSRTG
jgi:hypothetical protein